MAEEWVVFVLGGRLNDEYPWKFFHLDPFTEEKPKQTNLAFFDYPKGKLKIWKHYALKRGSAPSKAPDEESELLPKVNIRIQGGGVEDGPEKASVLALYEWVKQQKAGSINSLQVFCHAYEGGPCIWDSWEYDQYGNQLNLWDGRDRDPNDTDFRIRDFTGNNVLAGTEGRKFAAAFSPTALVKLWGCIAQDGVRGQLLRYLRAPRGVRGDATRRAHLHDYLGSIGASFAMAMANSLGLGVWGAPIGYGTNYGSKVPIGTRRGEEKFLNTTYRGTFPPNLERDYWWRVSWYFRNYDKAIPVYRDVLRCRIDALDYVEYKQSWFDTAMRMASSEPSRGVIDSPRDLQQRIRDRIDGLQLEGF